jgi:hypothetical protein
MLIGHVPSSVHLIFGFRLLSVFHANGFKYFLIFLRQIYYSIVTKFHLYTSLNDTRKKKKISEIIENK